MLRSKSEIRSTKSETNSEFEGPKPCQDCFEHWDFAFRICFGFRIWESAVGQKIERDHQRFRKLVRGKVKSNLSKYISRGEMIGKKGNDLVSIPLPQIDPPQFRYGKRGSGGVGQGEGDPGQPLTAPDGEGEGKAGDQPGGHILEVDLTMEELAE